MARISIGGRCDEKAGFLFAHECDREAVARCGACGKNICHEHLVHDVRDYCVSCARRLPDAGNRFRGNAFFYGGLWYSTHDAWGLEHDGNDFTEADGESTLTEGDETFESDLGAS